MGRVLVGVAVVGKAKRVPYVGESPEEWMLVE